MARASPCSRRRAAFPLPRFPRHPRPTSTIDRGGARRPAPLGRPARDRARQCLRRLANAIEAWGSRSARALAAESGKSEACARRREAIYGRKLMRYHARMGAAASRARSSERQSDETLMLRREPIGLVACLIPFNYPIYSLIRKIAAGPHHRQRRHGPPQQRDADLRPRLADCVAAAGLPAGARPRSSPWTTPPRAGSAPIRRSA